MFDRISDFALEGVSGLLAFFYELPVVGGSYGLAIVMLTLAVMVVLMPLTLRATRSTIKMTQLQPELRALQKEYKDDRQEMNAQMMALYQKHGVNPVGGCIPMLAQLPVFLILFNVLRSLTRRVEQMPYYSVSSRAHETLGQAPVDGRTFDPEFLEKDSALYRDLTGETTMKFGPFDLAEQAWDVVQDNFITSLPYIGLILFVVGSSYIQQRQVSARRAGVPDNATPQMQTQQQLLRILPIMSGVWSFLFPAGLVLYWATSNLFRIGQQAYITRSLYSGDGIGAQAMRQQAEDAARAEDDEDEDGSAKAGSKTKTKTSDNGDDGPELIGDGKPRSKSGGNKKSSSKSGSKAGSKNGSGSSSGSKNGSGGSDKSDRLDREAAWAQRRAQRSKAQESKKKAASEGSKRTTPKGTKPTGQKNKRKR